MNKNQNCFGVAYELSTKIIEAFEQCQKVNPNGELIIETPINTVHCKFGNVDAYTNETGVICINVEEYGKITRGIAEDVQPVKQGRWTWDSAPIGQRRTSVLPRSGITAISMPGERPSPKPVLGKKTTNCTGPAQASSPLTRGIWSGSSLNIVPIHLTVLGKFPTGPWTTNTYWRRWTMPPRRRSATNGACPPRRSAMNSCSNAGGNGPKLAEYTGMRLPARRTETASSCPSPATITKNIVCARRIWAITGLRPWIRNTLMVRKPFPSPPIYSIRIPIHRTNSPGGPAASFSALPSVLSRSSKRL